jgi:hypothetical protein
MRFPLNYGCITVWLTKDIEDEEERDSVREENKHATPDEADRVCIMRQIIEPLDRRAILV